MPQLENSVPFMKQFGFITGKPMNLQSTTNSSPLAGDLWNSSNKLNFYDGKTTYNLLASSNYTTVGFNKNGQDISSDINSALTTVSAAGGGVVFILPGRYPIAQSNYIVPQSNCTLMGAGVSSELYKTTNDFIIYDSSATVLFHDFEVNSLMFTGTVTNSPATPTRNRNVSTGGSITGPANAEAIYIDGSLDTGGTYPVITNITVKDCVFKNIASLPILLAGISGKVIVTGCEFTNNYDPGFKFNQEVIFIGNHSYGSGDNGVSISRGNLKVTCTGNTIENCCYNGIWVAGYISDGGPQYFSVTGNVIRACGYSGISTQQGGSYGVISGNVIDKQYYRGPTDGVVNSPVYGIYIEGDFNNPTSPSTYCQHINITGNFIKGAPRASILLRGVKNITVNDNLIMDTGSQYAADGSTAILSSDTSSNVGIYFPTAGLMTNVNVFNNCIIDSRATPYMNYAISAPTSGVTCFNNIMQGARNNPNLASQFTGGVMKSRTTVSDTSYTATANDWIIEYTSLTTGRTVTLPTAAGIAGQEFVIKDGAGSAGTSNITIATTSAQTIDGSSTKIINSNYGVVRLYSNGVSWLTD